MRLDHIAISGRTLEEAAEWIEVKLDVPLQPGGTHEVFGTHNRLLGLKDGVYVEAIAADPSAPPLPYPRWFDLDRQDGPPRVSNWICQVPNLDEALENLPQAGKAIQLSRGDLRWRMAVPATGVLPYDNCFPALIEWQTSVHPSAMLVGQGCRLKRLTVSHPKAEALHNELAPYLDMGVVNFETGPSGLSAEVETRTGTKHL